MRLDDSRGRSFSHNPAHICPPKTMRFRQPRIINANYDKEDFGKRNMPGKHARRHFSQSSEFERGLIIAMRTASRRAALLARWIVRSVPLEIVGSSTREGTHVGKTGSGETRKTTRREDQRIMRQALVDPTEQILNPSALPLTPEHRQLRLQWCQARSMWDVADWQKAVFSDESRFVLGTDDNRVWVWRRPGERYNSPRTVLCHTARTAGVMVWGTIAYDSRSTLIVMLGTLTGQRYVDDILRPHVGPFLNGLPVAIIQQDNARPHTARVAQDFLRHFQILPWPARFRDWSPVEHVWNQLKRQMPSCHSVHDLELVIQDFDPSSQWETSCPTNGESSSPVSDRIPSLHFASPRHVESSLAHWPGNSRPLVERVTLNDPRSLDDPSLGGRTGTILRPSSVPFVNCQVIYSQFGLAIHQNDHQARRRFVEWAPNEIAVVPDFHKRILFSDEAHFWLNGYVNKQNCRIWSEANPQVYVETPLHPEKLTVWCALWAGGILLQKR
ncbi:transposable element Tcb1 transposase [Trichonephila clavipes]|nr:transposable element Tcb1 transposase [Trichonephila clavipes]